MGEYDSSVALAQRLLTQKGMSVTVVTPSAAVPNADQPWAPSAAVMAEQTTVGAFFNYKQSLINGETIRTGDQQVYMPAADDSGQPLTPEVGGQIKRGTEVWNIVNVSPLKPADAVVLFEAQVRQ